MNAGMLQNIKYVAEGLGKRLVATESTRPTTLEPTEIMIRVKAVAINPGDIKTIDEGHRVTSWPLLTGHDGAGIVEAVGERVKNFAVGDEVLSLFALGDRGASFQNFAVVQEAMVAKKPSTWTFEDASTVGLCYFTAMSGLRVGLNTATPFVADSPVSGFKPSSILVLGGSSALGAAAIQLLRLVLPESTILVTSSPKHHDHLTETLGATKAFDRNSSSLIEDVRAATPEARGVEAIYDAVGAGRNQRIIFDAFDPQGPRRYAQVWTGGDKIEAPDGVDSVMFRVIDLLQLPESPNVMLGLERLLAEGKYRVPLPVRKVGDGLKNLEDALDLMRKGVSGEKLVVTI